MYYNMKRYRFNSRLSICFIFLKTFNNTQAVRREQLTKFQYLIYTWMKTYRHRYRQSCVARCWEAEGEAVRSISLISATRKAAQVCHASQPHWCLMMMMMMFLDSWCSPTLHCSLDFILLQQMHSQSTALVIQMHKAQGCTRIWWTTRIERVLNEAQ